jgi:hypothetical protein
MKYNVTIVYKDKPIQGFEAQSLAQVHEAAFDFVQERKDAFGEDREALERYGYIEAENNALSIGEDGGTVYAPDGYRIEATPINDNNNDKE